MGLAASTGRDNDELIDKLIEADSVVSESVEKALRLVDRARYFPEEFRDVAYRDLAWKSDSGVTGRLHISAPCIYASVLEYLNLQEGNSFLNIGSGTGYLNTVVGFLIGSSGKNHGIEIHENIVEYARNVLRETMHTPEVLCFDWAVPVFEVGNGLLLDPIHHRQYDRVYCGAAVPRSHRRVLWELIKVGGILVMPYRDQLQQVRRSALDRFDVRIVSSVSFSDFILPTEKEIKSENFSHAPTDKIERLESLCASSIRRLLRNSLAAKRPVFVRNYLKRIERVRYLDPLLPTVTHYRDGYESRDSLIGLNPDIPEEDSNEGESSSEVDFEMEQSIEEDHSVSDLRSEDVDHMHQFNVANRREGRNVGFEEDVAGGSNGRHVDVNNMSASDSANDRATSQIVNTHPEDPVIDNTQKIEKLGGSNSKKRTRVDTDEETSAKRRARAVDGNGETNIVGAVTGNNIEEMGADSIDSVPEMDKDQKVDIEHQSMLGGQSSSCVGNGIQKADQIKEMMAPESPAESSNGNELEHSSGDEGLNEGNSSRASGDAWADISSNDHENGGDLGSEIDIEFEENALSNSDSNSAPLSDAARSPVSSNDGNDVSADLSNMVAIIENYRANPRTESLRLTPSPVRRPNDQHLIDNVIRSLYVVVNLDNNNPQNRRIQERFAQMNVHREEIDELLEESMLIPAGVITDKQREKQRMRERKKQLNHFREFSHTFDQRLSELPLCKPLQKYVKYLC